MQRTMCTVTNREGGHMKYRQTEQAHYIGNDVIVLTYITKSTDGHVYLVDDLYIIFNARAIIVPASWKSLPPAIVVRKVLAMHSRMAA